MTNHRTRAFVSAAVAAALCCAALVSACGGGNGASTTTSASQGTAKPSTTRKNTTHAATAQKNASASQFDPSNFGDPATGANQWLPLKPGTQWTRQGLVNVGNRRLPHTEVRTDTDVSKRVDGVRTVIVLDQDTNGGQIAEQSLDYEAEDKYGNVWYLGSYTESYQGGQFVNASDAWLAGVNGAKPGILMPARPQPGHPFTQDVVPGIEAP